MLCNGMTNHNDQKKIMKMLLALLYAMHDSGYSNEDILEVLIFCLCQFMEQTGKTPQQIIQMFGEMVFKISLHTSKDYEA